MDTIGFGPAITLEVPAVMAMALSVFCGSLLAQSVIALPAPDSTPPGADWTPPVAPVKSFDLREVSFASDDVELPANSETTQRRLRFFGAGSNDAPRYMRSDIEVGPGRNLSGQQAAVGYRTEVSEISSRWWFSVGRTDVGFGVGSVALMAQPMTGAVAADAALSRIALASSPSLSMGIRRQTSAVSALYADATRTHSMGVSGIDSYSGKVGVEWKTADSRWSVAYSSLGMRLSSQSRMTVSLRKGGLGIYMRSQF